MAPPTQHQGRLQPAYGASWAPCERLALPPQPPWFVSGFRLFATPQCLPRDRSECMLECMLEVCRSAVV